MMKRLFSLVMVFVLTLSLGAGLCIPASAASISEAAGSSSHSYSGPEYIYEEKASIKNLTCTIPEFEIKKSGVIQIDFGGTPISCTYTSETLVLPKPTANEDGLVPIQPIARRVIIDGLIGSLPLHLSAPYNNLGETSVEIACDVVGLSTFPKTKLSVNGEGILATDGYIRSPISKTLVYSLKSFFSGNSYKEFGREMYVDVYLMGKAKKGDRIELSSSKQTTSTTVRYYGGTGISVTADCYSKPTGKTMTIGCSGSQLDVEEKSATCAEAGYRISSCSHCGYYEKTELNATGHSWYPDAVTAPTCTEKGSTLYKCKNCDDSWVGAYTAALGHNYSSKVTAPTCTQKGYTTYTCSACGDSYKDNYKDTKDHSYALISETAATCDAQGYSTYSCKCGDAYTEFTSALGHNFSNGTCSVCGSADPDWKPEDENDTAGTLVKGSDGNYYYHVDGEVATGYTGLADNATGSWYVKEGKVQFNYDGLITSNNTKYLVKGGRVNASFTGISKQDGKYYYFDKGVNSLGYENITECNGMKVYVQDGEVNFSKTGVVRDGDKLIYVKYGIWRNTHNGLVRMDDGNWVYMQNGVADDTYTGVAKLNANWVYVVNGYVNFNYSGHVTVNGVDYAVKYGIVQN